MEILGIDIGGTGIKGAIVNTELGELTTERFRVTTPPKANPADVSECVHRIVDHFSWKGPVGCGFPAVIVDGVARTSGNLHESWVGTNVKQTLEQATDCPVNVLNDADAAGFAEMRFGSGVGASGKVLLITIGTGLGSALFFDGVWIPNLELGYIKSKDGQPIEYFASKKAMVGDDLTLTQWASRFDYFLNYVNRVLSPDMFIIGGGLSKKFESFKELLQCPVKTIPASMRNHAGIIGAAIYGAS